MKYYLLEVTTYTDGRADSKSLTTYEDELEALGKFHQKLGGAMVTETYATELVQVVAGNGVVVATEFFERPVEPEIDEFPFGNGGENEENPSIDIP